MTTAVARCTNARGRTQTADVACWERCSSPPHWSSREYDTCIHTRHTYVDISLQADAYFPVQTYSGCTLVYTGTRTLELNASFTSVFYSVVLMHTFRQKHTVHTNTSGHLVRLFHTQTHTQSSAFPIPPCCLLYIVKSYCRYYVAAPFMLVFSLSTGHYNLQGIHTESFHLLCDGNYSLCQCIYLKY